MGGSFINDKSPEHVGACRGTFSNTMHGFLTKINVARTLTRSASTDVRTGSRTDVRKDVRTDVYMDVCKDVYTDVHTECRKALDRVKSKISPLRFRCTERQVWSSDISRVMGGHGDILLINVPRILF